MASNPPECLPEMLKQPLVMSVLFPILGMSDLQKVLEGLKSEGSVS